MVIVSEVQVIPVKPTNGLVGFGSCVINESIYIGSIGIYSRPDGSYCLTYPTKRVGDKNINIFYPINKECAQDIETAIVSHFEEITQQSLSENQEVNYNSHGNF